MASINQINVNGTAYDLEDSNAMRVVTSAVNNHILTVNASGQAVDSGVSISSIGLTADTLWTNTNSTSSFAGQTIPLTLTDYPFVLVVFRQTTTGTINVGFISKPNGYDQIAFSPLGSGTAMYKRVYTPKSTGIVFYAGREDNTEDNAKMIPRFIYGIK